MSLGVRIKSKRKELKMTQVEVAALLGVDNTTVSKWESDTYEPDVETLKKLAVIFKTSTDYLTGKNQNGTLLTEEKTRDQLLHEIVDDPDDYFFLDGYLDAPEEEKKELRRLFYENKKKMRENNIKPSAPMSLREFNEQIKKPE
ncbi:helix-turn-helix domain-containing protein [Brevibacillus sp. SIMBA_040]|uniref:helix-turn-helix domain-containing protein n=1 Tax=unclassified Brevibacillus TaxID=2684853 RepID=UPI00397CAA49